MEEDYKWKKTSEDIVASYTSVITKDGDLILPEECLTEIFQAGTDSTVVLTNSLTNGSVSLYTHAAFTKVCEDINSTYLMGTASRMLKRHIIGESVDVNIDKSGHIKMEPEFLMRIGLDMNQDALKLRKDSPVKILKYPTRIEIRSDM